MSRLDFILFNYKEMPDNVIGVEDRNWYDGVAYYLDKETGQRYSRNGYPISGDEMCKYGKIYKVKEVITGEGRFDYHYEILSERPDQDCFESITK